MHRRREAVAAVLEMKEELVRDGEVIFSDFALNDVVVAGMTKVISTIITTIMMQMTAMGYESAPRT